jgi:hypothetical protein
MNSFGGLPVRKKILLAASLLLLVNTMGCEAGAVDPIKLDEWFYSRLLWMSLAAAIVGVLAAIFHLCRLSFPPGEYHAKKQARKKFGIWLIIVLVCGSIWLIVDAWAIFQFDELTSLGFTQTLMNVFLNYRTFLVLLLGLLVFSIFVAFGTRFFKADCRCKYAFINK